MLLFCHVKRWTLVHVLYWGGSRAIFPPVRRIHCISAPILTLPGLHCTYCEDGELDTPSASMKLSLGVATMYSKFPQDIDSKDDGDRQPAVIDSHVDNVLPMYAARNSDIGDGCEEKFNGGPENYKGASLVQMAFLQLMTQKVMQAVANCPDALKLMDSDSRTDKE